MSGSVVIPRTMVGETREKVTLAELLSRCCSCVTPRTERKVVEQQKEEEVESKIAGRRGGGKRVVIKLEKNGRSHVHEQKVKARTTHKEVQICGGENHEDQGIWGHRARHEEEAQRDGGGDEEECRGCGGQGQQSIYVESANMYSF